jgi:hypothetical protein
VASYRTPKRTDAASPSPTDAEHLALARHAATLTTAALRHATADGAFDVVALAMFLTIAGIVRRQRGAGVLDEMIELAEEADPPYPPAA